MPLTTPDLHTQHDLEVERLLSGADDYVEAGALIRKYASDEAIADLIASAMYGDAATVEDVLSTALDEERAARAAETEPPDFAPEPDINS